MDAMVAINQRAELFAQSVKWPNRFNPMRPQPSAKFSQQGVAAIMHIRSANLRLQLTFDYKLAFSPRMIASKKRQ